MTTYTVTVKNISVNVSNLTIERGMQATMNIKANDENEARRKASKKCFNGCVFHSEGRYGNDASTLIGHVGTTGNPYNAYGKAWISVEETTNA